MLRYDATITVYQKNEEDNRRTTDFDYDQHTADRIREEIEMLISGVHLVDDEGNIYVLSLSNIKVS